MYLSYDRMASLLASYGKLSRLLEAHQVIIGEVRKLAHRAAELGDDGTNDLVVSEVLRRNELQAWLLSEHLVDAALVHAK